MLPFSFSDASLIMTEGSRIITAPLPSHQAPKLWDMVHTFCGIKSLYSTEIDSTSLSLCFFYVYWPNFLLVCIYFNGSVT